MMVVAIVVGLMLGRVILQMAQPRYEDVHLSAAGFFKNLPAAQDRFNLRLGPPVPTRSFVIQMLALGLILWAVLSLEPFENPFQARRLGIRLLVDTSGSMRTQQQNGTRMTAALREIETIIQTVRQADEQGAVCWQLDTFDLELEIVPFDHTTVGLRDALARLKPRALGTDLNLLRASDEKQVSEDVVACPITHIVVVTDQPAPDWAAQMQAAPLLWRDIAQPVENFGFREIQAIRNQLTGVVNKAQLELIAYGAKPVETKLDIRTPNGKMETLSVEWFEDNTATVTYPLTDPGAYSFHLAPGGAYDLDDAATINVQSAPQVRVDWQLPDRTLLTRLEQSGGWSQTKVDPDVRVVSDFAQADTVPSLIVGNGYATATDEIQIENFFEPSPILADLNLDVAEKFRMAGVENLPQDFEIILAGRTNGAHAVWIAERANPPAIYVPGLPTGQDELNRFSTTVFFNALRRLLNVRAFSPLYTLTSVAQPEIAGARVALHPEEGNTMLPQHSFGNDALLTTENPRASQDPFWAMLLALAALLFAFDRIMAAARGLQWN